jgi:hypothetical protein
MLLVLLIVLVLLFFGVGWGTRGHESYGSYSGPGIGLGGLLLIILVVLFLTGNLHL